MKIAVILLNYNDEEDTIRICNEYNKMKTIDKVIVVDNNSKNNDYDNLIKLRNKKTDVIKSDSNKGYAYGNNYGIRYLIDKYDKPKYICISNPDIYVDESAIKKCISVLDKDDNIAIAAPKMLDRNGNPHFLTGWKLRRIEDDIILSSPYLDGRQTEEYNNVKYGQYGFEYFKNDINYVDCVAGSFFIIRYDAFLKCGLFDENTFLYYEEDILGNKLKKLGYKNVVLGNYTFTHMEGVSVSKTYIPLKKYKLLQKSRIYYHKTYNENATKGQLRRLKLFTNLHSIESILVSIKSKIVNPIISFIFTIAKLLFQFLVVIFLPVTLLAKKLRRRQKVLYISLVPWKWIKQRPQFVSIFLGENGYDVTYSHIESYPKYVTEKNSNLVDSAIEYKNFRIKNYCFNPYFPSLNRFVYLFRCAVMNYDKIIFTQPNQLMFLYPKLLKLKGTKIYYEKMDLYEEWDNNKEQFFSLENRLCNIADSIVVSSALLKKELKEKYNIDDNKISLVRNGYDTKVFSNFPKTTVKMKHPNATYIGTIDSWFDFDSILDYAKKNRDISIYIIGPVSSNVVDKVNSIKEPNIYFIKPIEHKYVPDTIKQSDVMLLPFIVNKLIRYVDPVKMYEYLYMRKKVVSSYWPELNQFKNFVNFYDENNSFNKCMKDAFKSNINDNPKLEQLLKDSSWNERLKKYLDAIR